MDSIDADDPPPANHTGYEEWFRKEVEVALNEADDPNTEWIPHEAILEEIADERRMLRALIAAQAKTDAVGLDSDREEKLRTAVLLPSAQKPNRGGETV